MMKQIVRKMLPSHVYRWLRYARRTPALWASARADARRYAKASSFVNYDDDEQKLRAIITATYHNIEKGLSLPEPRVGFGVANIAKLVGYIDEVLRRFGPRPYLSTPISVLGAYVDFNERQGHSTGRIKDEWQRLRQLNAACDEPATHGGLRHVSRAEVLKTTAPVGLDFFESRHSCRQYAPLPVTPEQVAQAVAVAQKAPVVCNRQSGRVHAFLQQPDILRILELQGGARGFAQGVQAVFCITTDLRNFHGVGERYQGWIDGGLFAMSFLLGLHRQGIGSCCLNWSKDTDQDDAMRRLLKLPPHELIIMFVAAGHLPEQFVVAKSVRKAPTEVLSFDSLG